MVGKAVQVVLIDVEVVVHVVVGNRTGIRVRLCGDLDGPAAVGREERFERLLVGRGGAAIVVHVVGIQSVVPRGTIQNDAPFKRFEQELAGAGAASELLAAASHRGLD